MHISSIVNLQTEKFSGKNKFEIIHFGALNPKQTIGLSPDDFFKFYGEQDKYEKK